MGMLRYVIFGFLLLFTISSGLSYRKRNRCLVANLPFQRNVDLKRYVGRYFHQRQTPFPGPQAYQTRTIAKFATPSSVTTYAIGRDSKTNECITNLLVCSQLEPPGPLFNFTFITFDGVPTFRFYLARTNYVGYLVFYQCLAENNDGTCKQPFAIVESRGDKLLRRDRLAVSRVLRRLCVDESQLFSVRKGERCPEPEDLKSPQISIPNTKY